MEFRIPIEWVVQTILSGAIGWAVKILLDQLKEYREESKKWRNEISDQITNINDATQATMRTTILHYCEKYLSRGWVTAEERASLMDMHTKYVALNPNNGFINGYMDRVNHLPDKEI